jgi:hypothetical protein
MSAQQREYFFLVSGMWPHSRGFATETVRGTVMIQPDDTRESVFNRLWQDFCTRTGAPSSATTTAFYLEPNSLTGIQ